MPMAPGRAAVLLLLYAAAPPLLAQQYPSKPIRYVVPFPPAGATDILARFVAEKLVPVLGQQVVVENRPGVSGNLGMEHVAKSAPDGYTIVMCTAAQFINETLYPKIAFSLPRDFVAIGLVAHVPNIMEVHPSVPARTVKEFIALAKQKPGQMNYASSGSGTSIHMSAELFQMMTGTKMLHVPYKGSAPALIDLMAGQTQVMFDNLPPSMPYIKTGRLRPIAVTTAKRYPGMPDIPTIAESGVPGYEAVAAFGVLAPAGTPRDIVVRLNSEINRAIRLPDMQERFAQQGATPAPGTPEEYGAFVRSEITKWAKVVKVSGAKVE
ncbi:MAG TPA: tripartite tricarboxylate transporter substrate binding protein [Burkholderiales bacterium]|nr:tripartite tricarboxylate transporter substrate binding protein [Burkholderiales bacterium]